MARRGTRSGVLRLTEEGWRRHANPWSLRTRVLILPLLALAIWSRQWIGVWAALPVAVVAVFAWVNPRIFPAPAPNAGWCWRAVMGEKLLVQDRRAVPFGHRAAAWALACLSAAFGLVMAWGLHFWDGILVVLGVAGAVVADYWFLDRMAWVWEERAEETRNGAPGLENPPPPSYL